VTATQQLVHADSRTLDWRFPRPVKMICTDPPYGIKFQSRRGKTHDHDLLARQIASDSNVDEAITTFLLVMEPLCSSIEGRV
jgi:tRNA G10  N-methylase Trm11